MQLFYKSIEIEIVVLVTTVHDKTRTKLNLMCLKRVAYVCFY